MTQKCYLLTYGQTAPGVPFSFSFSSDTLSAGWTTNLVNMCFNQNLICLELIELPHPFDVHVGSYSVEREIENQTER